MNKDFKVGDILVMINAKNSWQESAMVVNKDLFEVVLVHSNNDFDLKQLRSDKTFTLRSHEKQDFRHATLKEQYLRTGNIVRLANGDVLVVVKDRLVESNEFTYISNYDDDLGCEPKQYEINRVYQFENEDLGSFSTILKIGANHKLIWERKPKIKLTDDEVVILKYVNTDFKYIARRNEGGELYAYVFEPKLDGYAYKEKYNTREYEKLSPFEHIFRNITFESGPHLIADLIKENE